MATVNLMSNIRLDPSSYSIDLAWLPVQESGHSTSFTRSQTKWEVHQDVAPHKLGVFDSKEEAQAFVKRRCIPIVVSERVYSDICRCGRCGPVWDYIKTGELVFERCRNCVMPMRHDVMLALNAPLTKDFDLDNFLEMF